MNLFGCESTMMNFEIFGYERATGSNEMIETKNPFGDCPLDSTYPSHSSNHTIGPSVVTHAHYLNYSYHWKIGLKENNGCNG